MTFGFKKITIISLGFLALILILSLRPTPALAVSQNNQFCDNISDTVTQINKQVEIKIKNITSKKAEQLQTLKNRRQERDSLISKQRSESDRQMVLRIEKLYKYAETPVQKQAVEKFKNEVSNAIATRRAAIDQAIQTYRKTLDAVFDENRTVIDTAVKNFQAETAKALNQAKVECGQKSASKIARQRLMAKSQTAQKHLTLALKFNTQPATQAAEALEEATQQATKTFNQALQKAQTELSKAFR